MVNILKNKGIIICSYKEVYIDFFSNFNYMCTLSKILRLCITYRWPSRIIVKLIHYSRFTQNVNWKKKVENECVR